jgi:hypothetical protein
VLITNILRDQAGRVAPGVRVVVRNLLGELVTEQTTNAAGSWSAAIDPGFYVMVADLGDGLITRDLLVCNEDPGNDQSSRTVLDQGNRPIAAAQVWIRDGAGDLVDLAEGNPVYTDRHGHWNADLEGGTYELTIIKGDAVLVRDLFICSDAEADTYFLLAEDGEILLAETGDRILYQ